MTNYHLSVCILTTPKSSLHFKFPLTWLILKGLRPWQFVYWMFLEAALLLLLLLLHCFSRVWLCATPQTAAHQALPSLGLSRQEHWSGPFPSPCMQVKSESEIAQSCPTLSHPMDHSLPGSSIHGILPLPSPEATLDTKNDINYQQ